jgi:UDP-GlcNAc:undecaprenyl-phosphate GlcNAc-1-phosphate transferase
VVDFFSTQAYTLAFLASFLLAFGLTPVIRSLAIRWGVLAYPGERKIHATPIPYLGGLSMVVSFVLVVVVVMPFSRQLAALLAGCIILAVVGAIDDIRGMSSWRRLGWQVVAAGVALAGGIGIVELSNPLGGSIALDWGRFGFNLAGHELHITPIANLISILWMVGMVNTINFLDGLDGLAGGVSAISALVIFVLSLSPDVHQPLVAMLALILAGSALGFLPFNFYPARIFMGDSGAYFLGLLLAMLAIYSGGKLATLLLVLGFTVIDALWAVFRRLRRGVHPFSADREHLHHLMLGAGLSQRRAVLALYLVATVFGLISLLLHGPEKFIALIVMGVTIITLIAALIRINARRITTTSQSKR